MGLKEQRTAVIDDEGTDTARARGAVNRHVVEPAERASWIDDSVKRGLIVLNMDDVATLDRDVTVNSPAEQVDHRFIRRAWREVSGLPATLIASPRRQVCPPSMNSRTIMSPELLIVRTSSG